MTISEKQGGVHGIEAYNLDGISQLLEGRGLPRFRTKQLVQWIYHHGITSYDQMTNTPAKMREDLSRNVPLNIPTIVDKRVSADGSRKYVLALADDALVETVAIPSYETMSDGAPRRLTVCFSTQVGCPMRCVFCATGREGFTRNLLPGEMVQQILTVQRDFNRKVTNVVAMGQGEPFLNYQNTIDALRIINASDALNIGARHITVSTCGILEGIHQFGSEPEQFTLAISLHSARQNVRNNIMPGCKNMPLDDLKQTLQDYYQSARRRISFEYLMIDDVNDTQTDMNAFLDYCSSLHVHVNLIPLNAVEGNTWRPSKPETMQAWIAALNRAGIEATIRDSRGTDIEGACGQLKNRVSE